jgi:hypothetical protein
MLSFKLFLIESLYNDIIFNYSGMQSLPLQTMRDKDFFIDRLLSVADYPTELDSDILTGSKDEAMAALNHPDLDDLFFGFFSPHEDVAHATLEHEKLNEFTKKAALQSSHENVAYRMARWGGASPRDAIFSRHELVAHYGLDQLPDEELPLALGSPHKSVRERARQILSMDE